MLTAAVKVPPDSGPSSTPALRVQLADQPSPALASPIAGCGPASNDTHHSQGTAASSPAKYSSKLDHITLEQLNAILHKHQEEKIDLLEKKERLMQGDQGEDLLFEDIDMIAGKM